MHTLRIFRRESPIKVLGPYARAVIWVQGCPFACPGCIIPESWDNQAGEVIGISDLSQWILEQPSIEGVTFSGGEPMTQADALCELIDSVLSHVNLGIMCFTGFTIEELLQRGTVSHRELLKRIDLLVDGRYNETLHEPLLWRGSSNQRLLPLTPRYDEIMRRLQEEGDKPAGLEFIIGVNNTLSFVGVPPIPQFRGQFEDAMKRKGIRLNSSFLKSERDEIPLQKAIKDD